MALVATLIANPRDRAVEYSLCVHAAKALAAGEPRVLAPGIACDILLPDSMKRKEAEAALSPLIAGLPIDIAVQPSNARRKKALVADMDSTMIDQECIDELAVYAGVGNKVAGITARSMNGEINFETALRQRVALLKDLPVAVIDRVLAERITLAAGGRELVTTMRKAGAWTALVSGGFTHFSAQIAAQIGFDEHRANRLLEDKGRLAGEVAEPILGREAKVTVLSEIASRSGLSPAQFIAVGDGANDIGMLALAGTGVALHAKPVVVAQAKIRIDHGDLTSLLYLQGYRQDEIIAG